LIRQVYPPKISRGAKTEIESYIKIGQALTHNPRDLLFISDGVKEVRAASDAGMQAIICDRDVQAPQSEEAKTIFHSFDEVFPGSWARSEF